MSTALGERSCDASSQQVISRTTLLILALILLGMGLGANIPADRANICLHFGCFGLASYVMLDLVARYRFEQRYDAARQRLECVLAQRLALFAGRHVSGQVKAEAQTVSRIDAGR